MTGLTNGDAGSVNKVPTVKFTKLFINGDFVDSVSGKTFETIDPRTGDVIARISEGDKEDIDIAVKAARQAFDSGPWPRLSGAARAKILVKWAQLIDENAEEVAALDAIDAGKLYHMCKNVEVPGAANSLRYYAGAADKIHGEVLKMSREFHAYTLLEPVGVVGHIIPWNFPTTMFFIKVSPSLASGCTMVLKPAEQTPLSALFCAHLAKLAGIPDGVLNVVPGFGSTAGAALSSHMDVDAVSFTGSTKTGREIMQAAAKSNLKQVSLELGGKSPLIIFDDADIDKATDLALIGILYNKGEVCVASSRVFVQEGIYDEFEKKLVEKAKNWVVGDPFDPKVQQGPQVDKRQFEKILSYIEHGKREGATLLTGGKTVGNKGYFIEPTIFSNIKEDMLIAQDEIFGPVMALKKFKTIEEAIKSANNTKYGLAAGIVTKNLDTANTVSRSIRAGTIWINCYFAFGDDVPFGGYKMSGFGKDHGLEALRKYLQHSLNMASLSNSFLNINMPTIKFTKLFINGHFVDSISGRTFETIDPRTEEVTARVSEGDKEDIDIAVKAAREAFDSGPWPRLPGSERAKIMMKWADLIEQNIEEVAALDTIDAGKLHFFNKVAEIPSAANTLRYYAGAADKIHGDVLKMNGEFHAYTLLEPVGVVGHIIPWNAPSLTFFIKVSPALAAGCTMVLKPAEQTPLSALFYAHLAKLAGIPDGVLNVVPGFGPTAGAAISSHMDIDAVSFTGSIEVGRQVMQAAARSNLKPVSLELGGKSPLIIFDDADIEKASDLALFGILFNKGEVCVASSRVFVQEGIYDEFEKKLVQKAKSWVVGDPFDPKSQQGPQADKNQLEKILSYIEHGKREGATLLTGGSTVGNKGYYIQPTIFSNVKEDMLIARDEIFGPVLALMKFKTMEEAIKSANNSKYGLAAGIVTKNLDTANTVSRSIRAGIVWINCYFTLGSDVPFGGYKMSGFGRDLGLEALHKYLQVKSVVTPIHNSPWL
ncbi:Aldehyde dehydrogenase family 2 member C4, partial [Mucuna pruriens]